MHEALIFPKTESLIYTQLSGCDTGTAALLSWKMSIPNYEQEHLNLFHEDGESAYTSALSRGMAIQVRYRFGFAEFRCAD